MEIINNLKHTFKKNPLPLTLSLVGIVMAFSAFIIISTQIQFEKDFDQFHPNADCIFRVDQDDSQFRSIFPPGYAEAIIHSSKHIEAGTVSCPFAGEMIVRLPDERDNQSFKTDINIVSEGFFRVFGIEVVEGNENCIREGKVAIPESMAHKWFGNNSPIGQQIRVDGSFFIQSPVWSIGAVYKDLPENTQIRNQLLFPLPLNELHNFQSSNFLCYLRIDNVDNKSLVADEFNKHFEFSKHSNLYPIHLVSLADV